MAEAIFAILLLLGLLAWGVWLLISSWRWLTRVWSTRVLTGWDRLGVSGSSSNSGHPADEQNWCFSLSRPAPLQQAASRIRQSPKIRTRVPMRGAPRRIPPSGAPHARPEPNNVRDLSS